ncbi:MAG: dTDP-4-dehydrorhamnose reductase [Spirochaetota bacterium]
MNILVTGSQGQLGSEIKNLAKTSTQNNNYIFTDIDELDISKNDAVNDFVAVHKVECIVNCAAYTAVDRAETDTNHAYLVNQHAVKNLVSAVKKYGIKLIHISTDFVFDGSKTTPYTEEDIPNPLSIYGKSKLAGEQEILTQTVDALIIRISWLYSVYGNNFVKTIIRHAKEKGVLNVVYDQVGTPTYARDVAKAIVHILTMPCNIVGQRLYHYSNEGVASWYDFAQAIVEFCSIPCTINPILSNDYKTPAKRPHYSVLDKTKIKKDFDLAIPYWRNSLHDMIQSLVNTVHL